VKFDSIRHFILDEADRMLDMGFVDDIIKISSYLPKERQTLMFSATMPPKIRELAKRLLTQPEQINIAISKPAEGVLQACYMAEDNQKNALIRSLLTGKDYLSVLIFSGTKLGVKELVRDLKHARLSAGAIHSDLEQTEREEVLRQFRNHDIKILVATDILSRGIDIDDIGLVINYDVPGDAEDYVHRVGRTARAEATGVAITFVNHRDRNRFKRIEELIEMKVHRLQLPPDIAPAVIREQPRNDRRKPRPKGRR
jgi:superfamily II DNA/RNA helicase